MSHSLTVPHLDAPTRLDKFLVSELPKISRASIQKAIKNGDIKINNKKVEVHHFLKPNDVITYSEITGPTATNFKPTTQT